VTPTRWIAQGATIAVPLIVEALNQNGAPQVSVAVNFLTEKGTVSLRRRAHPRTARDSPR